MHLCIDGKAAPASISAYMPESRREARRRVMTAAAVMPMLSFFSAYSLLFARRATDDWERSMASWVRRARAGCLDLYVRRRLVAAGARWHGKPATGPGSRCCVAQLGRPGVRNVITARPVRSLDGLSEMVVDSRRRVHGPNRPAPIEEEFDGQNDLCAKAISWCLTGEMQSVTLRIAWFAGVRQALSGSCWLRGQRCDLALAGDAR